ncbi:hypothetical protein SVAN01_10067 [Stagonosporopsis vannaccii]|nr:hypothetical protein SVAN01_10067 [Stagonosporopsis vannaccii]
MPLIVLSTFLHWLLLRTFFLVRIDVFTRYGTLDISASRSACGMYVLCFMIFFLLFLGLCITIRQLVSRKLVTGLAQAPSNGLMISAACHAPSDEVDPHLNPVHCTGCRRKRMCGWVRALFAVITTSHCAAGGQDALLDAKGCVVIHSDSLEHVHMYEYAHCKISRTV